MTNRIPDFNGFAEPTENYTKIPNELFDKLLSVLTPAELTVLLFIIRKTWGWQKLFDQIAISQFVSHLKIGKSTVLKALTSLEEECQCILRYRIGRGGGRKTYFFINTPTNRQIIQALRDGHLDIDQAQLLNKINPQIGVKTELNVDKEYGAETEPNIGSKSKPSRPKLGSNSKPTKRTRKKEKKRKKEFSPTKNAEKEAEELDAEEPFQEQQYLQKLRSSAKSHGLKILGKIAQKMIGQ